MKRTILESVKLLAVSAAFVLCAPSASGVLVYNNSTTRETNALGQPLRFAQSGFQFGDQIILSNAPNRTLTSFAFEYFLVTNGGALTGNEQLRFSILPNTGPTNASGFPAPDPTSALFQSSFFGISSTTPDGGFASLTFSTADGSLPAGIILPETFTWTVQFQNIGATALAGLSLYTPPTIGNNFIDYWERSGTGGTFVLREPAAGEQPIDFGARVDAVPEPSTIALTVLGIGFLALSTRRRRNS